MFVVTGLIYFTIFIWLYCEKIKIYKSTAKAIILQRQSVDNQVQNRSFNQTSDVSFCFFCSPCCCCCCSISFKIILFLFFFFFKYYYYYLLLFAAVTDVGVAGVGELELVQPILTEKRKKETKKRTKQNKTKQAKYWNKTKEKKSNSKSK